jgi:hypothetical protein
MPRYKITLLRHQSTEDELEAAELTAAQRALLEAIRLQVLTDAYPHLEKETRP